jgi:dihydrofolate reductase
VNFSIVVAADEANGIGIEGRLPWHLPGDMAFFKRTTSEAAPGQKNAVIMGRRTYDSIPKKFRPLKGRINIVLSRSFGYSGESGTALARSLDEALRGAEALHAQRAFVIGGGAVYAEALQHPECVEILLTRVHARFACDTFLPRFDQAFQLGHRSATERDGDVSYTFETYRRRA